MVDNYSLELYVRLLCQFSHFQYLLHTWKKTYFDVFVLWLSTWHISLMVSGSLSTSSSMCSEDGGDEMRDFLTASQPRRSHQDESKECRLADTRTNAHVRTHIDTCTDT